MSSELEDIASQLRRPHGEKGLEIASMMNVNNIGMTRHSIVSMDIQEGDAILEVGPGNALHLEEIFKIQPEIRYTGIDISNLMHAEAKRINEKFISEGKADFVLYKGEKFDFPDNSFDKIFTVNTLYFWKDPSDMLNELYRILKPKGRCCITFGHKEFMQQLPFTVFGFTLYTPGDVTQLVSGSLFQIVIQNDSVEEVMSKTGEKMTRKFTTLVLGK